LPPARGDDLLVGIERRRNVFFQRYDFHRFFFLDYLSLLSCRRVGDRQSRSARIFGCNSGFRPLLAIFRRADSSTTRTIEARIDVVDQSWRCSADHTINEYPWANRPPLSVQSAALWSQHTTSLSRIMSSGLGRRPQPSAVAGGIRKAHPPTIRSPC
jgi:hypothetical protein